MASRAWTAEVWIVDGWRQSPQRDVHEDPDCQCGVLVEGALRAGDDTVEHLGRRQRVWAVAMNGRDCPALSDEVADAHPELHHAVGAGSRLDECGNVDALEGGAWMRPVDLGEGWR